MANKRNGLLATLGKRVLGFSAPGSGCCAAPAAAEAAKAPEPQGSTTAAGAVKAPEANAQAAGCPAAVDFPAGESR